MNAICMLGYGLAMDSRSETGAEGSGQEKLALVIPTLREAGNIRGVLDHTRAVLDPLGIRYEILVVDDDSDDGTGEIVSAIAKADPRVRLIVRKGAKGVAGAILLGWENTDATILGEMDADALPVQRKQIRAKDPTSGFFLVRRACIDKIKFQRTGFKLLLEVLVRGRATSMKEIPFAFKSREVGASKATFQVACEYAGLLGKLYWARFGLHRSA